MGMARSTLIRASAGSQFHSALRIPHSALGRHSTPDTPFFDFIASDETLDRYDEVISPTGWKLENYQRNPVFQNAHKYGDIIFTLGKALVTEVRTRPPSTYLNASG